MKIIVDIKEVDLLKDPRLLIPFVEEKKRFGTDVMMTGLLDKRGEIVIEAKYDFVYGESIEPDDIIVLGRIIGVNDKMPYSFEHPYIRCHFAAYNYSRGIIHEGFDMFTISTDKKIVTVHSKDAWGAINSSGNWIIPYGKYTWIDGFDTGFVRARIGTITNGQKDNDAKWSLVTDGGLTVYSNCYDILPFYNKGINYVEIQRDKEGQIEKIYFEKIMCFLNSLSRTKPAYDPYGKFDYNRAAREQISDAYDGESDARWNTD